MLSLEMRIRRNNLKFILTKNHKMDKKFWQELDCIKLVHRLCSKFEVGIDENSVEVAHRLGNRSKDAPVLATFRYYSDKIIVL